MSIAETIINVLKSAPVIVMSWGFHAAKVIENGLSFKVQGFKHRGIVEVVYVEGLDLFTIKTISPRGVVKETEEGVYLDSLVSIVDRMVETGSDSPEQYQKNVEEWFK